MPINIIRLNKANSTIVLLYALMLMISCNSRQETYLIPTAKMEDILLDIQIAEVYSSFLVMDSASRVRSINNKNKDSLAVYYSSIFAKYKITQEAFLKSMDYYQENPKMLDTIYNNLEKRVVALKEQLEQRSATANP